MRNIILCSDGTGNTAVKGRGTNVWKIYEALDLGRPGPAGGRRQIAYYDDGVGTQSFKPVKLVSGAFGVGLKRNVKQLYRSLCRTYEPGDQIYMFGFSRGAYTVRVLAGLVTLCGLVSLDRVCPREETLADDFDAKIDEAYRAFRKVFTDPETNAPAEFRRANSFVDEEHAPDGQMGIRFMGVWDTVEAYGFPVDEIATLWNLAIWPFKFPDFKLSPRVRKACHALAIDDERRTFHPTLWDEKDENVEGLAFDQRRIEQVWFSGAHSNVGGGYDKQGLSLVSLAWVMERASQAGLRFLPGAAETYARRQNVNDKLYDSRAGLGAYYAWEPRDVAGLAKEYGTSPCVVHESVVDRIHLGTEGYAPANLPSEACVVDSYGREQSLLIPRLESLTSPRYKLRTFFQMATAVLSILVASVTLLVAIRWSLIERGTFLEFLERSSMPAALTAFVVGGAMAWSFTYLAAKRLHKRTTARIWAARGILLFGIGGAVASAIGLYQVRDLLRGPWFAYVWTLMLGALLTSALISVGLRGSIHALTRSRWMAWMARRKGWCEPTESD